MNNISSWDSYYVVFLSAILSLGVPASLALVSYILFPKSRIRLKRTFSLERKKRIPSPIMSGQRMSVRFFLAANAALILSTLALELIPCVTTMNSGNQDGLLKGIIAIVTVAGFAVLGLLYSIRKGDMGWQSSFQTGTQKQERDK